MRRGDVCVLCGATGDQRRGGEADGQQAKRVLHREVPRCKKGASAPVAGDYSGFSGDVRTASVSVSRSEEHTSELQSLMRISYAVFCLKKKNNAPRLRSQLQHVLLPRI